MPLMILVVATLLLAMAMARTGTRAMSSTPKSNAPRNSADFEKDTAIRERAREASIARQKAWNEKEKENMSQARQRQRQRQRQPVSVAATALPEIPSDTDTKVPPTMRSTETAPIDSAPAFDYGITSFRHMPHLPHAPHAAALMTQIAQNFVPIIRQRGYDIRTVSELRCCGDGLDYLLGGGRYCVPVGQNIGGHTASDVGGYNRLEPTRGSLRVHSIHLRLRCVDNHDYLRTYADLAAIMSHEMAHCIHRDHSAVFHELMDDIGQQHPEICRLEALTPAREQNVDVDAEIVDFNQFQLEEAQRNADAIQRAMDSFDE